MLTLAPEHLGLPDTPHPALQDVDVEIQVVDVALGVGRELACHQDHPASLRAYRGERRVRARQERDLGHGVLWIERPEPVARRPDRVLVQVRLEQQVQRRPELGSHLLDRELDPQLIPQDTQRRREPRHGVDESHVQVEADRELTGHASKRRSGVDQSRGRSCRSFWNSRWSRQAPFRKSSFGASPNRS